MVTCRYGNWDPSFRSRGEIRAPFRDAKPWIRTVVGSLPLLVPPLGRLVPSRFFGCVTHERLRRGLILILTGIEGYSFLNLSILWGLLDARVPAAVDICDWTTGKKWLALYHLRAQRRNRLVAKQIAQTLEDYQSEYPNSPIWLVGHSGGGAMAVWIAEAMKSSIQGLVLLAPALSRGYNLQPVISVVKRGVWCFYSPGDWFFLGLGTSVCGTMDGVWAPAAGMLGFVHSRSEGQIIVQEQGKCGDMNQLLGSVSSAPSLHLMPYRMKWAFYGNLGGHFGVTHRLFISQVVAPLILQDWSNPGAMPTKSSLT